MEPVSSLLPYVFGDKMWEVGNQHGEEITDIIVNGDRKILSPITYSDKEL